MGLRTRLLALSTVGAVALGGAVAPLAQAAFTDCTHPAVSQPFAPFGDYNFYALAPNGDFDDLASSDWKLSGGAAATTALQSDGSKGYVLDLPSGAVATTPPLCITVDYTTARLWSRNLAGGEGVDFAVSYPNGDGWTKPSSTGSLPGDSGGWRLSNPMNIKPVKQPDWQWIRISLTGKGKTSRFQVDDLWIDPRASR